MVVIPNHSPLLWVRSSFKTSLSIPVLFRTTLSSHRFSHLIHTKKLLHLLETNKSTAQLHNRFARMPGQTQDHLDDTDKMLLGEMAVKALTTEQVSPETDGRNGYHDHDDQEHIQGHDHNPLTATQGTLVKTDHKGNLVQNEKVSQTMLWSLALLLTHCH